MESDLRSLLEATFKVNAQTVTFLESIGCVTVPTFSTWCNDYEQVEKLAARSPCKDEAESPKLKAAWARAKVLADLWNKKESEGVPSESEHNSART